MFLIQNKAFLDAFDVREGPNGSFVLKLKATGAELSLSKSKAENETFCSILASTFFPNTVLLITKWLTANNARYLSNIMEANFNYRGLRLSEGFSTLFKYEPKPNIYIGENLYPVYKPIKLGFFNKRFFDSLIDDVLPLLKDENYSLEMFFKLFSFNGSLRGRYILTGNLLSSEALSIFSDFTKVSLDINIKELQGRILVGGRGIEILDTDYFIPFTEQQESINLNITKLFMEVPVDNLTQADPLRYNEEVFDIANSFYSML